METSQFSQEVEVVKETVRLGALDYLPNPFKREQSLKSVRGALSSAEKRDIRKSTPVSLHNAKE